MSRINRSLQLFAMVALIVACGGAPAPGPSAGGAPPAATAPAGSAPAPAAKPASPSSGSAAQSVATVASQAGTPAGDPTPTSAAAAQPAAPPKSAPGKPTVKLTFVIPSPSFAFVPYLVAESKGYFQEEGIEIERVDTGSGSKAVAAIVGRSAQMGSMDYSDVIGTVEAGQQVQGFAAIITETVFAIVAKKELVESAGLTATSPLSAKVAALKGKKIGISSPGSGTDSLVRYLLLTHQIDPEREADLVSAGSSANIQAAFTRNQIDAFSLASPSNETAVARSNGVILINPVKGEIPEMRGKLANAIVARRDYIEANPEIVQAVTRVIDRALNHIRSQPEDAKETVRRAVYPELDKAIYDVAWENFLPAVATTPTMDRQSVELNFKFKEVVTGKKSTVGFDDVATNRFAQRLR